MANLNDDSEPLVNKHGSGDSDGDGESYSSSSTLAEKNATQQTSWFQFPKYTVLAVMIISLLCTTALALQAHSQSRERLRHVPTPDAKLPPLCGNSPEEAHALGCTFDVYVNGWMPAACYDRLVAADSESNSSVLAPGLAGDHVFPIYYDKNFTKPATMAELQKAAFVNQEEGEDAKFYTTYGYHRAHCMHLWRLSGSAMERASKGELGIGIYYKLASYEHTIHCNTVILTYDEDPNAVDTIIPGVCRCVGLDDVWNQSHGWGGRPKQIASP
ncbi:MAG: hypothetical protein MMC23_008412 [Stictis urceolatum]|nr:hypothetical protein [Stictis urceolata]